MFHVISVSQGRAKRCGQLVAEIAFQYCYPRLDVNVSKGVNHLLKSPFCVHPKTGRVCVAMDTAELDRFDPLAVPDIRYGDDGYLLLRMICFIVNISLMILFVNL